MDYQETVGRLAELGASAEQRQREDEAIIALSKLTPTQAWEAAEEVSQRVGSDWLMAARRGRRFRHARSGDQRVAATAGLHAASGLPPPGLRIQAMMNAAAPTRRR